MTELEALAWCRLRNARIRFQSDGAVSVMVNGYTRRRPTFLDAVEALMPKVGG
jgi:hypothetical protein